MILLTTNINDEIFKELVDRTPGSTSPCSPCMKPQGVACTEWAKCNECCNMQRHFNDYVMFSTGTNPVGFQFATTKRIIENIVIERSENKWKTDSVEEIIQICTKNNDSDINEDALTLFNILKPNVVCYAYREPAKILGEGFMWVCYADGSGGLYCNGKRFATYDIQSTLFTNHIEYAIGNEWGHYFEGTMEDFQRYVEETVKEKNMI